MVVLVLQTLSLLTISLVTSTSASTKLLCFRVMSSSRSVLMVERFLAIILALMAAIFSTDMASDNDLKKKKSLMILTAHYFDELVCWCWCVEKHETQKVHSKYKSKSIIPDLVSLHDALFVALQTGSQTLLIQTHSLLILNIKAVYTLLANYWVKENIISDAYNLRGQCIFRSLAFFHLNSMWII